MRVRNLIVPACARSMPIGWLLSASVPAAPPAAPALAAAAARAVGHCSPFRCLGGALTDRLTVALLVGQRRGVARGWMRGSAANATLITR